MNVLLSWHPTDDELARLRASLPDGTEVLLPERPEDSLSRFEVSADQLARHAPAADIVIGWVLPDAALEAATNLRLICWNHAGCDELDFDTLSRRGIQVTNAAGVNGPAVAEHALALMLGLAKKVVLKDRMVREGRAAFPFQADAFRAGMLQRRTVGILGLGGIGSRVARLVSGFDMTVLGVRRNSDRPCPGVDRVCGMDRLHEVLRQSDFVVVCLPITPATNRFFGREELAAMKSTAFLINVSRGNLLQEGPLHDALVSGGIAGFGSDVWFDYDHAFPASYHFPVPSRTGLHRLENVLGSGDQGSNVDGMVEAYIDRAAASATELIEGRALTWAVDPEAGY